MGFGNKSVSRPKQNNVELPRDVWLLIFSMMEFKDIMTLMLVNKYFKDLFEANKLTIYTFEINRLSKQLKTLTQDLPPGVNIEKFKRPANNFPELTKSAVNTIKALKETYRTKQASLKKTKQLTFPESANQFFKKFKNFISTDNNTPKQTIDDFCKHILKLTLSGLDVELNNYWQANLYSIDDIPKPFLLRLLVNAIRLSHLACFKFLIEKIKASTEACAYLTENINCYLKVPVSDLNNSEKNSYEDIGYGNSLLAWAVIARQEKVIEELLEFKPDMRQTCRPSNKEILRYVYDFDDADHPGILQKLVTLIPHADFELNDTQFCNKYGVALTDLKAKALRQGWNFSTPNKEKNVSLIEALKQKNTEVADLKEANQKLNQEIVSFKLKIKGLQEKINTSFELTKEAVSTAETYEENDSIKVATTPNKQLTFFTGAKSLFDDLSNTVSNRFATTHTTHLPSNNFYKHILHLIENGPNDDLKKYWDSEQYAIDVLPIDILICMLAQSICSYDSQSFFIFLIEKTKSSKKMYERLTADINYNFSAPASKRTNILDAYYKGIDNTTSLLGWAVIRKNEAAVELLLEFKPNVAIKHSLTGETILCHAYTYDHPGILQKLVTLIPDADFDLSATQFFDKYGVALIDLQEKALRQGWSFSKPGKMEENTDLIKQVAQAEAEFEKLSKENLILKRKIARCNSKITELENKLAPTDDSDDLSHQAFRGPEL